MTALDRIHVRGFVNFALFQLAWFACVLGAASGRVGLGCGIAVVALAAHFAWWTADRRADLVLVGVAVAFGAIADSSLIALGRIEYVAPLAGRFAPAWILVLWAWFAATQMHSMQWLQARPLLAIALGLVGGPLSYVAGERLDALRFVEPRGTGLAMGAVVFGLATLGLSRLARHLRSRGAGGSAS